MRLSTTFSLSFLPDALPIWNSFSDRGPWLCVCIARLPGGPSFRRATKHRLAQVARIRPPLQAQPGHGWVARVRQRSEEHKSELQALPKLGCRLVPEKQLTTP